MPKKQEESRLVSALKEFGTSFLLGKLKNSYQDFLKNLKNNIFKMQKDMIHALTIVFIKLTGLIFILIAIIFLIDQYSKLTLGWAFLIIGILILILSFIIKLYLESKKLNKEVN